MRTPIILTVCALLMACAAVPTVDDTPSRSASTPIMGAKGPLTARQSKALLDKIAPEPGDAGILKRHLAIEEAIAETPLVAGTSTRLLVDGTTTFAAMFALIKGAKGTVDLEYYIFEDVESGGVHLGDLLIAKLQEGISINVIYDSYGSNATTPDVFKRLKDAGANIVEFNPVDALNPTTLNNRDHRKILVVDGASAIVGGINLSSTYESSGPGKSGGIDEKPGQHWRDTDLEIDGPVVAQLQTLFMDHWSEQKGPPLDHARYFPAVSATGSEVVRIVGSTPDEAMPRYYVTLLTGIRNAEKNIWMSAAYFVPTDQEEEDLIGAARRGVDVRLLLPSDSDSKMALAIGRSHYTSLLDAGVKIYEAQDEVLHSKTASIDGVWTAVGSSNFDPRSVIYNDEVDALVLGSVTAQDFQNMFDTDTRKATQINLTSWRQRPARERLLEIFELSSFLWQNWL
jgi:cardiolipin synthase A/B